MALHCPYCQSALQEETARCAVCGLCMDSADDAFGVAPPVTAGVCDLAGKLTSPGAKRLRRALGVFRGQFPQVQPTVVIHEVEPKHPLKPWTFWFFNRSGLGAALSAGSANRHVLLVLDPESLRAAVTVGYGLEPFLSPQRLAEILMEVEEPLAEENFDEASVRFVEALNERLKLVVEGLPRAFGLPKGDAVVGTAESSDAVW